MDEGGKLAHLVPHWIQHNESHVAQFEEWARRARDAGLGEVADDISAAAAALREANVSLGRAQAHLPRGGGHQEH